MPGRGVPWLLPLLGSGLRVRGIDLRQGALEALPVRQPLEDSRVALVVDAHDLGCKRAAPLAVLDLLAGTKIRRRRARDGPSTTACRRRGCVLLRWNGEPGSERPPDDYYEVVNEIR
jgi:hypothetical protein